MGGDGNDVLGAQSLRMGIYSIVDEPVIRMDISHRGVGFPATGLRTRNDRYNENTNRRDKSEFHVRTVQPMTSIVGQCVANRHDRTSVN